MNYKKHKSYSLLRKEDKDYIDKLIKSGYKIGFINKLLVIASRYHPFDTLIYIRDNILKSDPLQRVVDNFRPVITISIGTTIFHIPKNQLIYLLEWLFRLQSNINFSSKNLNQEKTKRFLIDIQELFNLASDQIHAPILTAMKEAIDTKTKDNIVTALSLFYIANYHQSNEGYNIFSRLRLLVETDLNKLVFKDVVSIRKQLIMYTLVLVGTSYTGGNALINIKAIIELTKKQLKYIITEEDILEYIENGGRILDYQAYHNELINNNLSHYFPLINTYGIFNYKTVLKGAFIRISDILGVNDTYYFFDVGRSAEELYEHMVSNENLLSNDRAKFYETYCYLFLEACFSQDKNKLNPADYQYGKSHVIKRNSREAIGDIDFYIFNKKTGVLMIFELKDRRMLGEDLYQLEKVEHLCSTWNEIPGRKEGKDGDIYAGVKQLERFIKMSDRIFLQEKLGLDVPITNIHGVFVTTKTAIGWNAIMKPMLSGRISLGDNEYSFASLGEIEHLLGMACEKGIPFDKMLLEKQRPSLDILDPLHILIGRLSTNDTVLHNKRFSYTDSVYQDFDVFLNSTYGKGNGFFPLSPEDTNFEEFLEEFLEKDNTDIS